MRNAIASPTSLTPQPAWAASPHAHLPSPPPRQKGGRGRERGRRRKNMYLSGMIVCDAKKVGGGRERAPRVKCVLCLRSRYVFGESCDHWFSFIYLFFFFLRLVRSMGTGFFFFFFFLCLPFAGWHGTSTCAVVCARSILSSPPLSNLSLRVCTYNVDDTRTPPPPPTSVVQSLPCLQGGKTTDLFSVCPVLFCF